MLSPYRVAAADIFWSIHAAKSAQAETGEDDRLSQSRIEIRISDP
jgi:hypothetical protein